MHIRMDTHIRWDDLQHFLAAHEEGSFSAAARLLMAEQSTVSRRVAALERRLGAPLFIRRRTGLLLTETGERILPLAREARDRIADLSAVARDAEVGGTVSLALTESMAVYTVIAFLERLFTDHPNLRIRLVSSTNVSDLSRREADLALRLFEPQRGDLVSTRVAELPNGVWGHRRWAGADWADLEWIDLDTDTRRGGRPSWVRANAPRPPRMTTNGFISMVEALRHGVGVAVLSDSLAQQVPDVVRIDAPMLPPPPTPVYLVAHTTSRHVPKVAAVWNFLESHLREFAATPDSAQPTVS